MRCRISEVIKYPQCSLNTTQSYFLQVRGDLTEISNSLNISTLDWPWNQLWMVRQVGLDTLRQVTRLCQARGIQGEFTWGDHEVAWTENAAQRESFILGDKYSVRSSCMQDTEHMTTEIEAGRGKLERSSRNRRSFGFSSSEETRLRYLELLWFPA